MTRTPSFSGMPPFHLLGKPVSEYSDLNWRQLAYFVGLDPEVGDFAKLVNRIKTLASEKDVDNPVEILSDPLLLEELRLIVSQFKPAEAEPHGEVTSLLRSFNKENVV